MMEFELIDIKHETHSISMTEKEYEMFFKFNIDTCVKNELFSVEIENEPYDLEGVKLNDENRKKLKKQLLEMLFWVVDELQKEKNEILKYEADIKFNIIFLDKIRKLIIEIDKPDNEWLQLEP